MKKYKDLCDYDFSDYAEEITGDALFKINGGAEVENSHEGVAGAKPGDTITRIDGTVVTLKQADIDYANAQLGNNGNNGTGNTNGSSGSNNTSISRSTNNSSSGANNTGISNTSTSESTLEVSEEIKQNSDAYANYMSLQGRAKDEGEPNRYKGYNVLGSENVDFSTITEEKDLINKEPIVKQFLGKVLNNSKNYSIEVYERKALFDYPWDKGGSDSLLIHSLYLITNNETKTTYTLSYNGTKKWLKSEGAWGLNTETDIKSYRELKDGKNSYSMTKLFNGYPIDTEKTAGNIIDSINSSTTYYAIDHRNDLSNMENCNTALYNTVFFEFMKN